MAKGGGGGGVNKTLGLVRFFYGLATHPKGGG